MQKGRTGRITIMNGVLLKSTLVVIFWFKGTYSISSSWYLEEEIPQTSRTIAKVTNILKALANTINMK